MSGISLLFSFLAVGKVLFYNLITDQPLKVELRKMDNKSCFLEKVKKSEVVFFADPGISYLSSMPSAVRVLRETVNFSLPENDELQSIRQKIIRRFQELQW
jgi:hypothetical protein